MKKRGKKLVLSALSVRLLWSFEQRAAAIRDTFYGVETLLPVFNFRLRIACRVVM